MSAETSSTALSGTKIVPAIVRQLEGLNESYQSEGGGREGGREEGTDEGTEGEREGGGKWERECQLRPAPLLSLEQKIVEGGREGRRKGERGRERGRKGRKGSRESLYKF